MPRNTRATARAGTEVLEDDTPQALPSLEAPSAQQQQVPSPAKPVSEASSAPSSPGKTQRPPLAEIRDNSNGNGDEQQGEEEQTTPVKKGGKKKGRKRKGKKKQQQQQEEGSEREETPEVKEDENDAPESPASEEAVELLRDDVGKRHNDDVVLDEEVSKPASATVLDELKDGGLVIDGAKGKEEMTKTPDGAAPVQNLPALPAESMTSEATAAEKAFESNAERSTRSVEETLEQEQSSDTQVPVATDNPAENAPQEEDASKVHPAESTETKAQQQAERSVKGDAVAKPKMGGSTRKTSPPKDGVTRKTASRVATSKADTSRPSVAKNVPAVARRSSVRTAASNTSAEPHHEEETAENGQAAKVKQRSAISALHTPPPVSKSTKPVTKSNFQLPGEAITARLKAQREERQKKQEEEAAKKREFKAKPMTKSKPVEVKATAASRARMSLNTGDVASIQAKEPAPTIAAASSSKRASAGPSTISKAPKSSILAERPKPTGSSSTMTITAAKDRGFSASVGTKPTQRPASSARTRTSAVAPRTTTKGPMTNAESAAQKQRGKEVFNRDKVVQEDREKMLKDKAEAAKKARAEAAERGRIASREWAEKKKAAGKVEASKDAEVEIGVQEQPTVTTAGENLEQAPIEPQEASTVQV